ncbi:MAG: ABC transporter permease [Oscillibacter sp.]|nr:ABC transporter permease [Oscillibacter sp.]
MSKTKREKRPLTKAERHTRMVNRLWLLLSLVVALVVLFILSIGKKTGRSFPFIVSINGRPSVLQGLQTMIKRDALWSDFVSSMISVALGFGLGFITSLPVAFLMAWYTPVRKIIEPWINFIRNIPALAYAPLIVIMLGVGRAPSVVLIWICTFMTMCITIFHGIRNIDNTLVKAARVLGANDMDIFFRITLPATVPFILTAVRLGLSAGLTTLLAAESTGAQAGLGMRISTLKTTFETDAMLGYIIIIGIIGTLLNLLVDIIEGRLTSWQEKREGA